MKIKISDGTFQAVIHPGSQTVEVCGVFYFRGSFINGGLYFEFAGKSWKRVGILHPNPKGVYNHKLQNAASRRLLGLSGELKKKLNNPRIFLALARELDRRVAHLESEICKGQKRQAVVRSRAKHLRAAALAAKY